MKNFFRILAVVFALTVMPALAQDAAPNTDTKNQSITVDSAELKKLIGTLESETARQDLIDSLKTLEKAASGTAPAADAVGVEDTGATDGEEAPKTEGEAKEDAAKAEQAIAPITQTLGVDSFTDRIIWKYQRFLLRNNLNESVFGKAVLTGFLVLLGAFLIFITRRAATRMLYWFDRGVSWLDLPASRMRLYAKVLRGIVTIFLVGLILYTFNLIWDFGDGRNAVISQWFRSAMRTSVNIMFVLVLAIAAWEALNALMAVAFRRADGANSTRAKTILPIFRNILIIVFAIMFTMVLLSELGINIVPLLAGAGVVGIAVGFGAQTMVKDFLSGFTLILEDVFRVGDVVNIGGYGGLVEKITLRKVQLRDYNGSVYTVPFSEIKTVTNLTKDFSMYQLDIGVAYKDDPDKVFEVMRQIDEEMRNEPAYKDFMLAPIEIAGVDRFADSSVIIKARLKTTPINQWTVGREYNRRLKKAFERNGIEIPFPQQVTWNANPQVTVFKHAEALAEAAGAKKPAGAATPEAGETGG